MPEAPDSSAKGRRKFLQLVGAAGVAAALPALPPVFAQAPPAPGSPPAPAVADTAAKAPEAPSEDARALTGILRRRFGDRLTEEQWESVARDFDGDLGAGKRLAAVKLANGDEPDFSFHA